MNIRDALCLHIFDQLITADKFRSTCFHERNRIHKMIEMAMGAENVVGFYFINFFIDCSAGVVVVYVAHDAICSLGKRCYGQRSALAHIGDYGEPSNVNYRVWAIQLGACELV